MKTIIGTLIFLSLTAGPLWADDLSGSSLEVTQAIQDLSNNVVLITGKKTYVRFHVLADGPSDITGVTATLTATRLSGGSTPLGSITPVNAPLTVKPNPDRSQINDSFLFLLPSSWRHGTIELVAQVDSTDAITESDETNNTVTTTVSFQNSPLMRLKLYRINYPVGDETVTPRATDLIALVRWLQRAYPIGSLDVKIRTLNFTSFPTGADEINTVLWIIRTMEYVLNYINIFGSGSFYHNTRYYGMVYDNNDPDNYFMRGKSSGIPSYVASGPTGNPDVSGWFDWDTDGSYGDWYGGHELGHTYGRYHAEFCGAGDGVDYPYADGMISDGEFFGFDVGYGPGLFGSMSPQVLPPDVWSDMMTYCEYNWISDFTYEGIYEQMTSGNPAASGGNSGGKEGKYKKFIMIEGRIDPDDFFVTLGDAYILNSRRNLPLRKDSDFTIRFYNQEQKEIARFPFTPYWDTDDSRLLPKQAKLGPAERGGTLIEVLPWNAKTRYIAVWHKEKELVVRKVSTNSPVVRLVSPNGKEVLSDKTVVHWKAYDKDGDPLVATLLYSDDNGKSWLVIDTKIKSMDYTVNLNELPGKNKSLFRVIVSDGVNTADDRSDQVFRIKR